MSGQNLTYGLYMSHCLTICGSPYPAEEGRGLDPMAQGKREEATEDTQAHLGGVLISIIHRHDHVALR